MYIWIARDDDGRLFLHFSEPVLDGISGMHWQSFPYMHQINIDKTPLADRFKDLKHSDQPVRLKIRLS